jgi:hypothetical protein
MTGTRRRDNGETVMPDRPNPIRELMLLLALSALRGASHTLIRIGGGDLPAAVPRGGSRRRPSPRYASSRPPQAVCSSNAVD